MKSHPAREVDEAADAARPTFNMTPMIDVTFQLIIVFLCSMKFRTLDMKIDALLPPQGPSPVVQAPPVETRVRVRLRGREGEDAVRVAIADRSIGSTADGDGVWHRMDSDVRALFRAEPELVAEIDVAPEVPHGTVMRALDTILGVGLTEVRFRGTPPLR